MPTERQTQYAKAKLRHWGAPVPLWLKHAPSSQAANIYGCDCKTCLPSGRRKRKIPLTPTERHKKLKASKKGQPVPPGVKHGIYAYQVYGCRCKICVTTNEVRGHRQRWAWKERATAHWDEGVDATGAPVDIVHWPPIGEGMWECEHCLEKFPHRPAPPDQPARAA